MQYVPKFARNAAKRSMRYSVPIIISAAILGTSVIATGDKKTEYVINEAAEVYRLDQTRRSYQRELIKDIVYDEMAKLRNVPEITLVPTQTPMPQYEISAASANGSIIEDGIAYTTEYDCDEGFCGNTASGRPVAEGTAACDPSMLGREFSLVGDPTGRNYLCADTGSAVWGNHVDIFFYRRADGDAWLYQMAQFYAQNYPDIARLGTYAIIDWK